MWDFIKSISESVTSNVHSRIRNPFFGSFVFSWVMWNWHDIALLFWGKGSNTTRISNFKSSLELDSFTGANSLDLIWIPVMMACAYLLLIPYLNLLIQSLQSLSDYLRDYVAVGIEVRKQKHHGKLVKAKAIANQQDEIAKAEITAQRENTEANTKRLQAEAEAVTARKNLIHEKYLEAQEKVKEQTLTNETLARKEAKKSQETTKATFAFEKSKAEHENELLTLKFPLAYQYMNTLSDSLNDDERRYSLFHLSEIIAATFGYQGFEQLIKDESFTAKNIKKIKYLSYDSETLFDCLNSVIESENEEDYDSSWLFEHIQMTLDQYSLQLQDLDSVAEEAIEELWDTVYSEMIEADAVNSEMAITNAHFDDVDDLHKVSHRWVSGDGLYIKYSCTLSGSNDPDKMFYGDTIYVDFEVKHPLVIGESGLGGYEMYDVKARGKDYSDESDWEHLKLGNKPAEASAEF
ncbi:conserved hypothetical protein [Vibrio crassostreae]|uniref:hypothetical protein n=2 Tax=Vibrio crassostreae TaxID=246167 RepID=UPI000637DE98|nr:hypothetical protein [Vibrio crassostreae]CAK2068535.1 conserved hypothetical protein [Vibrio crassostreae]CAK2108464.1 conserved hypothetical protein [Vibrio crassostreae]CAK2365886.1 conserved hypothetical protein [Vibrio crassostreae]CAK2895550.1 conserved hypothetical protein [Vibrio crassostreae]CAK2975623.1 conserved hypothetical protein [Vibrio crassostreae]